MSAKGGFYRFSRGLGPRSISGITLRQDPHMVIVQQDSNESDQPVAVQNGHQLISVS
jgi:hypothetical protein